MKLLQTYRTPIILVAIAGCVAFLYWFGMPTLSKVKNAGLALANQECVPRIEKEKDMLDTLRGEDDLNPDELLPADENKEWSELHPENDSAYRDYLEAGHHYGINTCNGSKRYGNLQLRSEPSIPKMDYSPWNMSTHENSERKDFEIGQV